MKAHEQWHELNEVHEGAHHYIVKHYSPNSYEIKNELSWLTSNIFQACVLFRVPEVIDASIKEGYIKMEKVDNKPELGPAEMLVEIIALAVELHAIIKSPEPRLRNHASASEFVPYLRSFTENKIALIQPDILLDPSTEGLIMENLDAIVAPYFSVTHRDLRYRHVLQSEGQKPVLIDWEFSNISHFGHDLAKLVCDYVVNHGFDANDALKIVIGTYRDLTRLPEDLIFKAVRAFIPLVLLEHSASFIQRKCTDYLAVAQRDIDQIAMFARM